MKALVKNKKTTGFEYQDLETPKIKSDEVLVKVKASAICGSDVQFYKWNEWCEGVVKSLPFIPGHEGSGEVVEVGRDVRFIKPKDKVAFETHLPCGMCFQCQTGNRHICQKMELFGHTFDGCFAQFCKAPEVIVRKIPDKLSFYNAALLEPMGVSLRAVSEGNVGGDSVCVIGCGPIGQFAIGLAKMMGGVRIFGIDINESRLEIAGKMGATDRINPAKVSIVEYILDRTERNGCGIVIDASGDSDAIAQGFKILRKGGQLFMIGNPKKPLILNGISDIIHKEARVRGLHGREMFKTWEVAESILASGLFDVTPIVTHKFSLKEYEDAFNVILNGDGCKVLLIP